MAYVITIFVSLLIYIFFSKKIKNLNAKLGNTEAANLKLSNEVEGLNAKLGNTEAANLKLSNEVEGLNAKLGNTEAANLKLSNEVEGLNAKLGNTEAANLKLSNEVEGLNAKLGNTEAANLKLSNEVEGLNKYTQIKDLNYEVNLLFEKIQLYKKDLSIKSEQLNILNNEIEEHKIKSYGFYQPHYDFPESSDYALELKEIKGEQKAAIKNKYFIESSQLTDNNLGLGGLALRAFNAECDQVISKVTTGNIIKSESDILKIKNDINKILSQLKTPISISDYYMTLKHKELYLVYEFSLKKEEEKEEQRAIREQMREEEKLRKEVEKAQREAAKEQEKYEKYLAKAKLDFDKLTQEKRAQAQEKIDELEKQLQDAIDKGKRATSMAQLTRRGHIYIISNIGSFGENVYKIGMTRRLEPLDRVKELGDASVPFYFDVHAMILSDDAPTLEKKIHSVLNDHRVNKVNHRREFFKIDIDQILEKVKTLHPEEIKVTKAASASQFRETMAIEEAEVV